MDNDFYEGNSYDVVYADCTYSGTVQEACEDIIGQLKQLGVQSINYSKKYLAFDCWFSAGNVLEMTKTYRMRNPDLNAL